MKDSGWKWVAAAIVVAALIIAATIWAVRPKADPESSVAACKDADGVWTGPYLPDAWWGNCLTDAESELAPSPGLP